jgi:hypothetical protein
MSAILLSNPTNPVEVPMAMFSVDDWQNKVPVKNVPGTFPLIFYDTGDFPLRVLNFWPIPSQVPNSVRIYSWQALPAQTLLSVVDFPPGYAEAFRYNLAVRLGAEFAAPASTVVVQLAIQALARVKSINAPDVEMQSDLVPSPAGYNYKADLFGIPY